MNQLSSGDLVEALNAAGKNLDQCLTKQSKDER